MANFPPAASGWAKSSMIWSFLWRKFSRRAIKPHRVYFEIVFRINIDIAGWRKCFAFDGHSPCDCGRGKVEPDLQTVMLHVN